MLDRWSAVGASDLLLDVQINNHSFFVSTPPSERQIFKFSKWNLWLYCSSSSHGPAFSSLFFSLHVWVQVGKWVPFPRNLSLCSSCVLVSSPPPVHPCWVSLYHPSTLLSHHVGQNVSLINTMLTWGRERNIIQRGAHFQGYIVAELWEMQFMKHCHAIIFNCISSVPPFCLTKINIKLKRVRLLNKTFTEKMSETGREGKKEATTLTSVYYIQQDVSY